MIRQMVSKSLLALSLAVMPAIIDVQTAQAEWSFKVTNSTKVRITRVEAAEKGSSNWGSFSSSSISPGETITLVWDSSTDGTSCFWKVRAFYADGESSAPATFDFCKEPDIEFSE